MLCEDSSSILAVFTLSSRKDFGTLTHATHMHTQAHTRVRAHTRTYIYTISSRSQFDVVAIKCFVTGYLLRARELTERLGRAAERRLVLVELRGRGELAHAGEGRLGGLRLGHERRLERAGPLFRRAP